ncbi:hypothetical protein ON010_g4478 [Phytophthora cinnamomi]|nr:hypothetical protein ON010_g4478 [Phytophthora cinnamomi]
MLHAGANSAHPQTSDRASATNSTSSERMPSKKRKSAHVVREGLNEELRRLREQLKQLNPIAGLGSENAAIFRAIRQQQLNLASAQSAILPLLQTSGFAQNLHPLHSQIRLGKSWESRRATLLAFRETKFRAAYEYITALTQTTNSDELRHSDERFETAGGDICCVISQTIHFPGVRSLKQVYESLIFSLNNAEISISERLGNVTVRDDYGDVNGNTFNSRIMSTGESGITTELNCVMLSQLFDDASDVCGGQPCGMVIIDSVDEDDLYPNDTMGRRCGPIDAQRVVLEAVGDFSIVFIRFGLHQEELFDKFANERVALRNIAANFDDCFQNDYIIIPGVPATISKLSTTNAVHAPNPSFQFV